MSSNISGGSCSSAWKRKKLRIPNFHGGLNTILSHALSNNTLSFSLSLSNNMLFLSFSFFLSLQLSLSKTLYVDTSFAAQSLGLHKTRSFFSSIFPSFWSLFLYLVHSLSPLLSHSFSLTNAFAFCEPFLHYTLYSFLSESLSHSIS